MKSAVHPLQINSYRHIVFFTGAGMSAESGVPTYRGSGGIWHQYRWEDFACQAAFERDPQNVIVFHELRRRSVLSCQPHNGHYLISRLQTIHPQISIITQNIDGMHQRAGSSNVVELHGSLWRLRCNRHGVFEDHAESYKSHHCSICGSWLRPDIVWFGDNLDQKVMKNALFIIANCDLFISIGTSGVVWPAAGFPQVAKDRGAFCIEINPEPNEASHLYDQSIRLSASGALERLFKVTP
jgi:NAD-dependent deacetylase